MIDLNQIIMSNPNFVLMNYSHMSFDPVVFDRRRAAAVLFLIAAFMQQR